MSSSDAYETFRTVLTMNLCNVVHDPDVLRGVLEMVDVTMHDFELSKKPMEIIPADGVPEVVRIFLASKGIANLSVKTLRQYKYKLDYFFNTIHKNYMDINANDIRIYLYNFKIERDASDSYVDNVRKTLNSFFTWLVDNEYLPRNPCAKVDKIRYQQVRRTPLSTLSLEDMRWKCVAVREKALLDFIYSTGCRVSECADVLLSDIDWDRNSVLIRHGKGNKERTVFFNDESRVSLREYLASRTDSNPALWVSVRAPHQQLQPRALENIVAKIGKRTGVHAYPHRLRHTFATVCLRNGMPLEQLQALLGHSDPKTTLIYAKQDQTQLRMDYRKAFS